MGFDSSFFQKKLKWPWKVDFHHLSSRTHVGLFTWPTDSHQSPKRGAIWENTESGWIPPNLHDSQTPVSVNTAPRSSQVQHARGPSSTVRQREFLQGKVSVRCSPSSARSFTKTGCPASWANKTAPSLGWGRNEPLKAGSGATGAGTQGCTAQRIRSPVWDLVLAAEIYSAALAVSRHLLCEQEPPTGFPWHLAPNDLHRRTRNHSY